MKKIIFIASIMAIFLVNVVIFNIYNKKSTIYSEAKYIADFNDNTKVSWFADNLFVWEIVENVWWIEENGIQNTLFKVHVLYNIKWQLKWTITIKQEWWYDTHWNLYIWEWTELFKEKWVYLFASRWEDYQILSHTNWSHLLFFDENIKKGDLENKIISHQIVKEFQEAYKNEVYFEGNFKISSEKNAYKDLTPWEKENFEISENWFDK